jgi:hypothetical protein
VLYTQELELRLTAYWNIGDSNVTRRHIWEAINDIYEIKKEFCGTHIILWLYLEACITLSGPGIHTGVLCKNPCV